MRAVLGAALTGALIVGVVAGLTAAPASADGGCPAGQPCIIVRAVDAGGQSFVVDQTTLDGLTNVTEAQYRTNTGRGGPRDEPYVARGASVARILQSVNLEATATRVVTSAGPGTHQTQLDRSEFEDPSPFQGGLRTVFFSDSPQFIRFARPMYDDGDVNVQDVWSGSSNSAVYLDVYTSGRILRPTIRAATTSTKAGTSVGFAVVFRGYTPAGVGYAWTFGDGQGSAAAAPSHVWARGGSSYSVNLTVSGADGAGGSAPPVVVQVGKAPPKTKSKKPGTGSGGSNNPVTGPSSGSGHSGGGTQSGTGSSSTGSSSPGTPSAAPSPSVAPSPSPAPAPTKPPQPKPAGAVAGERIQGVLLVSARTDADPTRAQVNPPSPRAAAAARAVGTDPGRWHLLWWAALPAALLLGAASQSRWWWRRRPTAPWTITP